MKRVLAFLTIWAILALLVPLALAQELSPAGGKCLEFNGMNTFLSLKDSGLVDKDFTVEGWILIRSLPKKRDRWVIATKPGTFELSVVGYDPDNPHLVSAIFGYCFARQDSPGLITLTKSGRINQLQNWHHISGSFDSSSRLPRLSFDGRLFTGKLQLQAPVNTESPFYVGGIKEWKNSYFDGFIDEIRISNVVRYKNSFNPPKRPFKADKNTVALWHFDGKDEFRFRDSSGNGNTLVGKAIRFSVEPAGKLSTRWAEIKSEY